ncbi:hypothetical protein [Chitinophaga sp. RAB17]|uniref:hypothetical protein n=1 Tax=Chitinophaga sp. RAB17 TaxID=3233049 RepID=UPI003F914CBB
MKATILYSIILILFSCGKSKTNQERKDEILSELLHEYAAPEDSLKREAAIFLIKYLPDKTHLLRTSTEPYEQIICSYHQDELTLIQKLNSLSNNPPKVNLVNDVTEITAAYLKNNIDNAFLAFDNCGWKNQVSFNTFCEYILPYKLAEEPLEYWRDTIFQRNHYLKNIWKKKDLTTACTDLNRYLSVLKEFNIKFGEKALHLPPLPFSSLDLMSSGSCSDFSHYGTFVMRTAGVPVTMDFAPLHGNFGGGHEWVALVLDTSKCIPFDVPSGWGLGTYKAADVKNPKIYRYTYSTNPASHLIRRGAVSYLPTWFNNPSLIDVTNSYIPVSDVNIPLKKEYHHQFIYLNCFDNKKWVPVCWTTAQDSSASFEKMGREIVYLPTLIEKTGASAVNIPFLLDKEGKMIWLKPDTIHTQTVTVDRKFPLREWIQTVQSRMVGGRFQGANKADFSDAEELFVIQRNPTDSINTVRIPAKKAFRYVRYLSPKQSSGNVSEINFYNDQHISLKGKIIGTEGSYEDMPDRRKEAAFDGNPVTFVDTKQADSSWVGFAFDIPVVIRSIDFRARSDNNGINVGHDYELLYWSEEGKWKSAGRKIADYHRLTFSKVPSGALYLFHNYTTGQEERIFTFDGVKQVWW